MMVLFCYDGRELTLRHEAKEVRAFAYGNEAGSKVCTESSSCTLANSCKSLFYRMNSLAVLQSNMTLGSTVLPLCRYHTLIVLGLEIPYR